MLATGSTSACYVARRAGVSATLNGLQGVEGGIELVEKDLPIPAEVKDTCGLLGLDPLQVANKGSWSRSCRAVTPTRCSPSCGSIRTARRAPDRHDRR